MIHLMNSHASLLELEHEGFAPKVRMRIDTDKFVVKTVETLAELKTVLGLRYDIFHREFMNSDLEFGIDVDRYDAICDHLIIQDKSNGKLVGTYRLISSTFSEVFYSQEEFHLDQLLRMPGNKLELGRACIDRSYRSGVVITLLWRGLAQYVREVKADYLFGCSSAKTMDPGIAAAIHHHLLEGGYVSDAFGVSPKPAFAMPELGPMSNPATSLEIAKEWIPSLLNSYLKAGAKVCGAPALDRDFQCTDFFTVLQTDKLTKIFERKYQVV